MSTQSPGEFDFQKFIEPFKDYPPLDKRVLTVLESLPHEVQTDFVTDDRFRVTIEEHVPGSGWSFWMPSPTAEGEASRCVVLRPRLATSTEAFAYYVIAHEFAHAFLRHGSRSNRTQAEAEADALAAEWGYARPKIFR